MYVSMLVTESTRGGQEQQIYKSHDGWPRKKSTGRSSHHLRNTGGNALRNLKKGSQGKASTLLSMCCSLTKQRVAVGWRLDIDAVEGVRRVEEARERCLKAFPLPPVMVKDSTSKPA